MKTGWTKHLIVLAVALLGAAPAQQDHASAPQALFRRLRDSLGAVETMKADFVQERRAALFTDVLRTEGVFYFSRPRSLRFEVLRPFRSVLLVNGRQITEFEYTDGKWNKTNPDHPGVTLMVMKQLGSWMRGDVMNSGQSQYRVASKEGEPLTVVLTPKDEKVLAYCREIELRFAENPLRMEAVTVREQGDDYTRIAFSNETRNVKFPTDLFEALEPSLPVSK